MKRADWLTSGRVKRVDFARAIGVSPGAVTLFCRGERAWLSRESAERIVAETRGAVTPNDFLNLFGSEPRAMSDSVNETVEAFTRGEIVIVTDDDDRENEGDMIV